MYYSLLCCRRLNLLIYLNQNLPIGEMKMIMIMERFYNHIVCSLDLS